MMKFYYAPGSCAMSVHILLEDAEAKYEANRIDLDTGYQRSEEYLAINPKGRVPALITESGVLTETPAILSFIAKKYPDKNLAPNDQFEFARAQAFNMYLSSTVHVGHSHKHRGTRWANDLKALENMTSKVTENMTDYAQSIEDHYFIGPWVLGDKYSMCDPYLYVITKWFYDDGVDMKQFSLISHHYDRMKDRPSLKKIKSFHKK